VDWLEVVVVVVAVAVGALAQASGGFGIALISGPALVAVDPAFVPVPLMIGGLVVGTRHLVREWNGLDGTFLRQCLIGMPVGVVAGHLATSAFSERGLKVTVGLLVVVAVVFVGMGIAPPRGRWTGPVCGLLVAFGTRVAALPGPPFVILNHDRPPSMIRPNMSALNVMNAGLILGAMTAMGDLHADDLGRSALVCGSAVIGLVLAPPVRRRVDATWFRQAVLCLAGLGGLAVVVGELI
jgi:uncharacterized protein